VKGDAVDVVYTDAAGEHTLQVDKLVVAVGRRPFTEGLLAEGTGVKWTHAVSFKWTSIAAPTYPMCGR
jgi:pyruvate/2-oxoglutarate dehydrogenase complex dihydrolipoamide dehydrogenase (E3) component